MKNGKCEVIAVITGYTKKLFPEDSLLLKQGDKYYRMPFRKFCHWKNPQKEFLFNSNTAGDTITLPKQFVITSVRKQRGMTIFEHYKQQLQDLKNECDLNSFENQSPE